MLFSLIARYGLALVFINILLQTLGLPVPAYPVLIVTASTGLFAPPAIVAVAIVAALIGDAVWFAAGRRYGGHVLALLCRLSLSRDSCVRRTEIFLERWGVRILVVAKFIPGLSTLALPVAAALGVRWRTFVMLDAMGALLWSSVAVLLGRMFAGGIGPVLATIDTLGTGALVVVAIVFALYLAYRLWQRRRLLETLRAARISVDELQQMMTGDTAPVVIDVRTATRRQFDPVTIPGALALDVRDEASWLANLPRDRKIVLFCTCPNEASAALVAHQLLRRHGFNDVSPLRGGLDAWRAAGLALEDIAPSVPKTPVGAPVSAAGA